MKRIKISMILQKWPKKRRKNVIGEKKTLEKRSFSQSKKKTWISFKNAMSGNTEYEFMCLFNKDKLNWCHVKLDDIG